MGQSDRFPSKCTIHHLHLTMSFPYSNTIALVPDHHVPLPKYISSLMMPSMHMIVGFGHLMGQSDRFPSKCTIHHLHLTMSFPYSNTIALVPDHHVPLPKYISSLMMPSMHISNCISTNGIAPWASFRKHLSKEE